MQLGSDAACQENQQICAILNKIFYVKFISAHHTHTVANIELIFNKSCKIYKIEKDRRFFSLIRPFYLHISVRF